MVEEMDQLRTFQFVCLLQLELAGPSNDEQPREVPYALLSTQ
jgi:hypothetical protein